MNEEPILYVARIIEDKTGKIVRESKPMTERQANKLADGMGINLNWERYSTEVTEAPKEQRRER